MENEEENQVELQIIIGESDSEMIVKLSRIIERDTHKIPTTKKQI